MSIDNDQQPAQTGNPLDPSKRTDADRQEIKRLAQQFEAMLMTQMLREMRRRCSTTRKTKENGFGAEAMTDTADVELGRGAEPSRRHRPDRELAEGLRTSNHAVFRRPGRGRRGGRGRKAGEGQRDGVAGADCAPSANHRRCS